MSNTSQQWMVEGRWLNREQLRQFKKNKNKVIKEVKEPEIILNEEEKNIKVAKKKTNKSKK